MWAASITAIHLLKRTRRSFCFFPPRRMDCVGWVVMEQQSHQSAHDNTKRTAWQKPHQPRISNLHDTLWCASVYVHIVCPAIPIAFSLDENTGDTFSSATQVCFWAHTMISFNSGFCIRDVAITRASIQPVICQHPCVLSERHMLNHIEILPYHNLLYIHIQIS